MFAEYLWGNPYIDIRQIPLVKRARDYQLYTESGARITDLYLNGGQALFGHRPIKFTHQQKNIMSQGLYASYPSRYDNCLEKSVKAIFPSALSYRTYHSLEAFCSNILLCANGEDHLASFDKRPVHLWRPFTTCFEPQNTNIIWALILPIVNNPAILVLDFQSQNQLPASTPLPARYIAELHYGLQACKEPCPLKPRTLPPQLERVRQEFIKQLLDGGLFAQRGPYYFLRAPSPINGNATSHLDKQAEQKFYKGYSSLWLDLLGQGCLLPPSPYSPLCLPPTLSEGQYKTIAQQISSAQAKHLPKELRT